VRNVKNLIVWGNHSTTQYPDVNFGYIKNYPKENYITSIRGAVSDDEWIQKHFIGKVAKRGAEIIEKRKLSSAASAANACCDHIHDWLIGTLPGEYVSMAVMSDGSYGIPKGINFSYPVECRNGNWDVVKGYIFDEFSKKKIDSTVQELLEERKMALDYIKANAK